MKNGHQRILTGFVYGSVTVGSILLGQYAFLILFSVVLWLCLREFYGLINTQKGLNIRSEYHCLGGLVLFGSTFLSASGILGNFIFLSYLLYLIVTFIAELYKKHPDPIAHIAYIFMGHIYIALPLSLLNLPAFPGNGIAVSYYPVFILSLFVFIWVNDSMAYATGMLLGKHRLFLRISPKKSWEGFFGGLIFTLLSSLVFAHFEQQIPFYHWIGISIAVVLLGTFGDLIESLMKRTLNIKDSGNALPGHGGFLDRFDSLLLAVYAFVFYIALC
jgi:phosphatidate cytidylyltransferase